jgi:hypothetical protein
VGKGHERHAIGVTEPVEQRARGFDEPLAAIAFHAAAAVQRENHVQR